MTLTFWIFSGIIAGWLAGTLLHGGRYEAAGDFLFGLIGGVAGGLLGKALGVPDSALYQQIMAASAGSALTVLVLHLRRGALRSG
jgi:uncharacterized membrane protein YeaQ/YmgE (transglycosylase-associated protein family)